MRRIAGLSSGPHEPGEKNSGAGTGVGGLISSSSRLLSEAEDVGLRWHPDTNAAELAYILYQVPVLVAVHGRETLPN